MKKELNILALIPARKGSKSIRNKNIRIIRGKPLIAYSIEHALESKYINRVIVSTDSKKYANISKKIGAEVPFIRPTELSTDVSTDLDVFSHCMKWLEDNENYSTDIFVHLRPTHPIRDVKDIDNMVEILINNPNLDSVRSIVLSKEIPFKMWLRSNEGAITPVINSDIPEAYNRPRQELPTTYYQNASIDVVRANVIKNSSMSGKNIYGYIMNDFFDIDDSNDLKKARRALKL